MVFKCLNNLASEYLNTKFQYRTRSIHLRNFSEKNDLNLPECRIKIGQKSVAYRGSSFLNNLLKEVKDIDNLQTFKEKFFSYLFRLINLLPSLSILFFHLLICVYYLTTYLFIFSIIMYILTLNVIVYV